MSLYNTAASLEPTVAAGYRPESSRSGVYREEIGKIIEEIGADL